MNLKSFKEMDVNILLGIVNMKLRDDFEDLNDLIAFYDISKEDLIAKLKKSGYKYNETSKQFH